MGGGGLVALVSLLVGGKKCIGVGSAPEECVRGAGSALEKCAGSTLEEYVRGLLACMLRVGETGDKEDDTSGEE